MSAAAWEVGKTYLTVGRFGFRAKVTIVATDLQEPMTIGGVYQGDDGKSVESWYPDGRYNRHTTEPAQMDLTTDEATS